MTNSTVIFVETPKLRNLSVIVKCFGGECINTWVKFDLLD